MENIVWLIWLVIGIGLLIAEVFTLGFFLLWFGVGAIAAALVAMAGGPFLVQFLVFAVVSVGLTAMSRSIFARYFSRGASSGSRYGVDALPGKVGTVTSASSGALNEAAVKVFGSTWTAFPADGETKLLEGEKVEVVEVRGSSIYVRQVEGQLPSWRDE